MGRGHRAHVVRADNTLLLASVSQACEMGTALGNTSVKPSFAWNAFYYRGVWAVCIIGLVIAAWAALRSKRGDR